MSNKEQGKQSFFAEWKGLKIQGIGGTVPMLAIAGVFGLVVFIAVLALGGVTGWVSGILGTVFFIVFVGISFYAIKRALDTAERQASLESNTKLDATGSKLRDLPTH